MTVEVSARTDEVCDYAAKLVEHIGKKNPYAADDNVLMFEDILELLNISVLKRPMPSSSW